MNNIEPICEIKELLNENSRILKITPGSEAEKYFNNKHMKLCKDKVNVRLSSETGKDYNEYEFSDADYDRIREKYKKDPDYFKDSQNESIAVLLVEAAMLLNEGIKDFIDKKKDRKFTHEELKAMGITPFEFEKFEHKKFQHKKFEPETFKPETFEFETFKTE